MKKLMQVLFTALVFGVALLALPPAALPQDLKQPVLVVALDKLDGDPMYARSVMVAVPRPAGGHVGFILNKPATLKMGDLFPQHAPSLAVTDPVYVGGPVSMERMFAMTRAEASPGGRSFQVAPGVWAMIERKVIDDFMERSPNGARYYAGYVGWRDEQLAEEIRAGLVLVRPLDPAKLFEPDAAQLYRELVTPTRKPKLEA